MPKGKQSSVKAYQANPDAFELNLGKGPTFVPKGSQGNQLRNEPDQPDDTTININGIDYDYAKISEDL